MDRGTFEPPEANPFQFTILARGWDALQAWVQRNDPPPRKGKRAFLVRQARICYLVVRDFVADLCLLQSGALTYITVLSLVPVLAVAFALLKGLGAWERLRMGTIEPFLDRTWGAAGSGAEGLGQLRDVVERVLDFVQQTNFGALGTFGLLTLLYTVIHLLGSVERAFNTIWNVQRSRSLVRKLTDYLAMVVVTPVFLLTATAAAAAGQNSRFGDWMHDTFQLGGLTERLLALTPLFTMWVLLTFVYWTLPNTRVRFASALVGGLFAGTLWHLAQLLHVKFQIGVANYNKIYAGFAAFPLFLVWLYVSWVIVLLGAELAWAHQAERNFRPTVRGRHGSQAFRDLVALRSMLRVARAFLRGAKPPTSAEIADEIGVDHGMADGLLRQLEQSGLVAVLESPGSAAFVPARDPGLITIQGVLEALKGASATTELPARDQADHELDRLIVQLDGERTGSAYNKSLRDLVEESEREDVRGATKLGAPRARHS